MHVHYHIICTYIMINVLIINEKLKGPDLIQLFNNRIRIELTKIQLKLDEITKLFDEK